MTIWNGLTSDGAVVPIQVDDEGRVVAVGSGPDSPLVVDGDFLRPRDPDLGLGTANIDLDAAGSAAFAGGVTSQAKISSNRDTANLDCFSAGLNGNTNAIIRADGNTRIGGVVGSDPNIELDPDGSATFASTVKAEGDSAYVTVNRTGTLPASAALYLGFNNGDEKFKVSQDGSATFADDVSVGNTSPVVNSNEGGSTLFGGSGGLRVFRSSSGVSSAIDCQNNGVGVFALKTDGSATFAGNVVAKNISAFSVVLKAALINSDTVQEIKTALTEALAALVPPDASTMPAPEPDASTMPAPAPPKPESR